MPHEMLAAVAALQSVPTLAWVLDPDLRLRALAGPLTTLLTPPPAALVGRHIHRLNQTDSPEHPANAASQRALRGDRTPFVTRWCDHWWQCIVAPIWRGRVVTGVLGVGSVLRDEAEPEGPEPMRLLVTADDAESHTEAGDRLVVFPGPTGRARLVRPIDPDTITRLLMQGSVRPFSPSADAESPGPGAADRRARHPRPGPRLVREG